MTSKQKLEYLYTMGERFPNKEDNPFKWNRWLGFIQGAMWALDVIEVDELKKFNKEGLKHSLFIMFIKIKNLLYPKNL